MRGLRILVNRLGEATFGIARRRKRCLKSLFLSNERNFRHKRNIYMHTLAPILRKKFETTAHATKSDADHIELTKRPKQT